MKITVQSSPELATIETGPEGMQVRIWRGRTDGGAPVVALIARLGTDGASPASDAILAGELLAAPTTVVAVPPPDGVDVERMPAEEAARQTLDLLTRVSEALIVSDGLVPEMSDPFHASVKLIRDVFAGKPRAKPPAPRARRDEPSWLVKDFWILYQSAKALAEACNGRGDGRPYPPLRDLEAQLARLAPAFEVCEAERRGGSPDRLTEAERAALSHLHRWLHSPSGDCALIDGAQDYHTQVEREDPSVCAQLEAEEKAERTRALDNRAGDVVDAARRVFARVGLVGYGSDRDKPPAEHGAPECTSADAPPAPELAAAVVRKIIDDPRVSAEGNVPDAAAMFLAHALQGARMGWHARTKHPAADWPRIVEHAAPPEGAGNRVAWLFGFEVATTEPEAPLELTDELRDYRRRYLAYRAPEQLTPYDRAIIAACDAEDEQRARGVDPNDAQRDTPNDWKPDPDWRELPGNARDPKGEPS